MRNVIDGFEQLTPQQCFDMAARHVLANGKPSLDEGGSCAYSGIGCAAAPFLTPQARSDLSNGSWEYLVELDEVPGRNCGLIESLQYCHDFASRNDFIPDFKEKMRTVAKNNNLSPAVLDAQP